MPYHTCINNLVTAGTEKITRKVLRMKICWKVVIHTAPIRSVHFNIVITSVIIIISINQILLSSFYAERADDGQRCKKTNK